MDGREYLAFTRKERNGIFVLLLILIGVIIIPKLFRAQTNTGVTELLATVDLDSVGQQLQHHAAENFAYKSTRTSINDDDPPRNYKTFSKNYQHHASQPGRYNRKPIVTVEINSADTSQFIALPFVGSKLASRIVMFREKLGGFHSIEQLREVYGLNDTAFLAIRKYLKCDVAKIQRLRINDADQEQLKAHPYIRWQMARLLVNYRSKHGPFRKIEDFLAIEGVDTSAVRRISPYLEFD